eukprot:16333700-Heterocapsa_arctica.AAC.1
MVGMYMSREDTDTHMSIRQATAKTRQDACHWTKFEGPGISFEVYSPAPVGIQALNFMPRWTFLLNGVQTPKS